MKHTDDHVQISDYSKGKKLFLTGSFGEAFDSIVQYADHGNLRAKYLLACYYHMGLNTVYIDINRRNQICREALSENDPLLLHGYAVWCLHKDEKARRTQILNTVYHPLLVSAQNGDLISQHIIGTMHMDREWQEPEYEQAAEWFKQGAAAGYPASQNALGWLYSEGKGVEQDPQRATELFCKAAKHGYANAQLNLGVIYAEGIGVPADIAKAIDWYQKAAAQGYAPALLNLGWLYSTSESVDAEPDGGLSYFLKAAQQGNVTAMYNLVNIYRRGIKTEKNIQEAANWYLNAMKQEYAEVTESLHEIINRFSAMDDETVIWPR